MDVAMVGDKEDQSITIMLSHPRTPEYWFPVFLLKGVDILEFGKRLCQLAEELDIKETELPDCISKFMAEKNF
jgi:hypothetical protein